MPSYADEIAARRPEWQRRADTGPVRLTISRGDSYRGLDGQLLFGEKWETEEIMDIGSIDAELDGWQSELEQSQGSSLIDSVRERLGKGDHNSRLRGFSLLVLDTNVLLSVLDFLKTFVEQCLNRNVFALSNPAFQSSPIAIIIPHIVLSELDNLKTSGKGNIAPVARAANAWLLSANQAQKKQMYDAIVEGAVRRTNIPESSWVLHIENKAHTRHLSGDVSLLTPDEQIVQLCVRMKKDLKLEVFLCSDDVNARLRAEAENLSSFSFRDIVATAGGDKEELAGLAADVIDQWQGQVFGSGDETEESTNQMEEDNEVSVAAGSSTSHNHPTVNQDNSTNHTHQHIANNTYTGRTTQHSIFAAPIASTSTIRTAVPIKALSEVHKNITPIHSKNKTHTHQYPKDRSTASSMWAS